MSTLALPTPDRAVALRILADHGMNPDKADRFIDQILEAAVEQPARPQLAVLRGGAA